MMTSYQKYMERIESIRGFTSGMSDEWQEMLDSMCDTAERCLSTGEDFYAEMIVLMAESEIKDFKEHEAAV